MRALLLVSLACGASLLATDIAAQDLDSREYKLMLQPSKFGGKDPSQQANELWTTKLKPIIARELDAREDGDPRHDGSFNDSKERQIVFRDTADCTFDKHGYALRERAKLKKGQLVANSREITLKFRIPDIFIAADARPEKGKAKFEEDIAPLIAKVADGTGKETGAAFAQPPSMRSMFSVSMEREPKPSNQLATFADAIAVYPDLPDRLSVAGAPKIAADTKLEKGRTFHEVVLEGASVDLGHKLDAGIDLSLWYEKGAFGDRDPEIAELSFKYKIADSDDVAPAARRALKLFKALQRELGDWASPERETKTSLALPKGCH